MKFKYSIGEPMYTLSGGPREGKIEKAVRKCREFYHKNSKWMDFMGMVGSVLIISLALDGPKEVYHQRGFYRETIPNEGQNLLLLDSTYQGGRFYLRDAIKDTSKLEKDTLYDFEVENPFIGDRRAVKKEKFSQKTQKQALHGIK